MKTLKDVLDYLVQQEASSEQMAAVEAAQQALADVPGPTVTITLPIKESPDGASECDNCGAHWHDGEMDEVKHFWERVTPGNNMPSGECPDCGALCYPTKRGS